MTLARYANAPCNPLIIDPKHDPDHRYVVTCIVCGPDADQTTDSYDIARQLQATHQRNTRP